MQRKSIILIIGFFCLMNTYLSAYSLSDILSNDIISQLKTNGSISRTVFKEREIKYNLTPNTPLSNKAISSWPETNGNPVFMSERLYIAKKSSLDLKDGSSVTIDKCGKVMRSISKMQGMQYYSHSDKKIETLYSEFYCTDAQKDGKRIPDDLEGSADGKKIYCMQKDNSFGKINFQVEYHQYDNEMITSFINTTPVYAIIKAINSGNLYIDVVMIDCGDQILSYLLVRGNVPSMEVVQKKMNDSFSSRLDAIYSWFTLQFK